MALVDTSGNPFEFNGYTYVALAPVIRRMGGSVNWDNTTKTAQVALDGRTATVQMANDAVTIDGRQVRTVAPPLVTEDTMIVPTAFFGDVFNRPL
jgi:hypothetical protein